MSEKEWGIDKEITEEKFSEELKPAEKFEGKEFSEPAQGFSEELQPARGRFSEELKPAEKFEERELSEPHEEEATSYDEPLLSKEEIVARLKQHHQDHGIPVPAIHAGGKRIKQHNRGPHVTHKQSLVEQRDERHQAEQLGDTAEQTSAQLAKQDHERELALKDEEWKRLAIKRARNDPKIFPATYFPPEPQNDYQRSSMKGGLNTFQPPMHGKTQ